VQVLTEASPERLKQLTESGEFFWLDLAAPGPDQAQATAAAIGLEPAPGARAFEFGHTAQLRHYKHHVSLVFYAVREPIEDAKLESGLVEVHVLVSGDWIVSIHADPCPPLDQLRENIGEGGPDSEQSIVAELLDALADTFTDLLEPMDDRIGHLEEAAAGEVPASQERTLRREILHRRSGLLPVRRVVRRQRDYIDRALDELADLPGLDPSQHHELRDVSGQMIRTSDRIDDALDRLTAALDLLNSTVSNRLNEIMKRLTVVATIFLPLTVVTGFFGQNFKWLTDHIESFASFAVFGIALLLGSGIAVGMWVRARLERGGDPA
jgi:magnesium transporter